MSTQSKPNEAARSAHIFSSRDLRQAVRCVREKGDAEASTFLCDWVSDVIAAQTRPEGGLDSRTEIHNRFRACLDMAGIKSGKIAELGGPHNSSAHLFPAYDFEFLSLFPVEGRDDVKVCDITDCPHIPSDTYDAVFSISVMEHVAQPWKAGPEITRIVKDGGIVFHAAPFSYFYHGAPADFWRYTPDSFNELFRELKPMIGEFYGRNRRRDNRGGKAQPVDLDGGPQFAVDALGGWRENWFTIYCGQKDTQSKDTRAKTARIQIVMNLMRQKIQNGLSINEAAGQISRGLVGVAISEDGEMSLDATQVKSPVGRAECVKIWTFRQSHGVTISYSRFVQEQKFNWLQQQKEAGGIGGRAGQAEGGVTERTLKRRQRRAWAFEFARRVRNRVRSALGRG